jgi:hypothetical protein
MSEDGMPTAHTKHGDLTIDEIAEQLPGMARLMVEVSDRYWLLYYAAKGGNWDLASHELSELRKTLRMAAVVRPKYRDSLAAYDSGYMAPLQDAIKSKDFAQFEAVYEAATNNANDLHRELGYEYIDWTLPAEPPKHLRLTAG